MGTPQNIIAQASTTSNNNTNNVSNNNSTQGNKNYAFTTPSTKNNSTGSSFNVYGKNGATSLEAAVAPWDQGGSGYISRLIALSNNRTNGNISSNCITSSKKKRKDRGSSDSSVSLNNSIPNNNIQQDGAPQLQHKDLRIGNIANLHKIIKLLPSQHSKTETMGLMCLHSIINKQIGKLIFNDDNNMWLVMDDKYLLTTNDDTRYTGFYYEPTSEVYGTSVKDFLEEVYAHVIINEKLLVELLGGNKEAYLILNHILDAKQYHCKVKEEYALVYWLETDIARDLLYVTLDEDDIEPYTSATPEMIDETSQRLISDISSSQPTFYSRIKSAIWRKRESVDDDADLDRPAKKQKMTKLVEAVTGLTDLVTRPAKKLLTPLAKGLLKDEITRLENNVQEVEDKNELLVAAQYKAALERQRLTNQLSIARGEADLARERIGSLETQAQNMAQSNNQRVQVEEVEEMEFHTENGGFNDEDGTTTDNVGDSINNQMDISIEEESSPSTITSAVSNTGEGLSVANDLLLEGELQSSLFNNTAASVERGSSVGEGGGFNSEDDSLPVDGTSGGVDKVAPRSSAAVEQPVRRKSPRLNATREVVADGNEKSDGTEEKEDVNTEAKNGKKKSSTTTTTNNNKKRKRAICFVGGCPNQVQKGGVCKRHVALAKTGVKRLVRKEGGTATPQEDDIIVGNDSNSVARAISKSLSEEISSKVTAYVSADGDDAKKVVAKVRRFQYSTLMIPFCIQLLLFFYHFRNVLSHLAT